MQRALNSSDIYNPFGEQWGESSMCISSQILSEASCTERAPREGPRGQNSFCFPTPTPFPPFYTASLCLLFSTCGYRYFYLISFIPVPFHCGFSTFVMNVHHIDFTTPCWAKITDYREQEALHSQRTQIYPANCGAWQPNPVYWKEEDGQCSVHMWFYTSKGRFSSFLSWLWSFVVNLPQFDLYHRC